VEARARNALGNRFAISTFRTASTTTRLTIGHFVNHTAEEEGIGLFEVLDRVTMQVFFRGNCTMIAAPVQSDVDGIPKGWHCGRVLPVGEASKISPLQR